MRIHEVSLPLHAAMVTYPGDPPFSRRLVKSIAGGDGSDVSLLRFGAHTGTHVDAPAHMVPGAAAVDDLDPEVLVGPAVVVASPASEVVTPEELSLPGRAPARRVLVKTRNSELWRRGAPFRSDFVHLSVEAARLLIERGARLVGVDYLSVDRFHSGGHPVHRELMSAGAAIIEGLDLSGVEPGRYELVCAPLRIRGGEAAPARVWLIER